MIKPKIPSRRIHAWVSDTLYEKLRELVGESSLSYAINKILTQYIEGLHHERNGNNDCNRQIDASTSNRIDTK